MQLKRRVFIVLAMALVGVLGSAEAAWAPLSIPSIGGLKLLSGDGSNTSNTSDTP